MGQPVVLREPVRGRLHPVVLASWVAGIILGLIAAMMAAGIVHYLLGAVLNDNEAGRAVDTLVTLVVGFGFGGAVLRDLTYWARGMRSLFGVWLRKD